MKKFITYKLLFSLLAVFIISSCSDEKLDEIDTNPNSPTDVPLTLLLPQVTADVVFAISGTDLAWYSSVFVEHTAGVHGQLQNADDRVGINATIGNNTWNTIYAAALADLKVIIEKGSEGGTEAGNWVYVGIAKVLTAYTLGIATDTWGRIPFSEALQGSINRKPVFDSQQDIYATIQDYLDQAIADFGKSTIGNPGNVDMIYGGNVALWTKAAYALKARYHNRLSKRDPNGSATAALSALNNSFASASESMIFTKFTTDAIGEHPWFQESNDRSHHAVSNTFFNILSGLNDPRGSADFFKLVDGMVKPAPSGDTENDQAGVLYSRASAKVVFATAPMPLITYDEIKFIEAESNLRLGNAPEAKAAYEEAVEAALTRVGVTEDDITAYLAQPEVVPATVTLDDVITQKYISFWLFQPIEAYNDYRRTGIPALNNVKGPAPRRFPYPQGEIDSNGENVPGVALTDGVWWDDGSED